LTDNEKRTKFDEFVGAEWDEVDEKYKEWKRTLERERRVGTEKDNVYEKRREEIIESFYRRDPFLRFTYAILPKHGFPYPYNCFIITIILAAILVPLGYHYGILWVEEGEIAGFVQSTTALILFPILPVTFYLMYRIYNCFFDLFSSELRNVVDEEKLKELMGRDSTSKDGTKNHEEYDTFLGFSFFSMSSKKVRGFSLLFASGAVLYNVIYLLLQEKPWVYVKLGPVEDIVWFVPFTAVWVVMFFVIVTVSWHLLAIVRTMRRFCMLPLKIRPLHPDRAGGLKPLSSLALRLDWICLLGIFVIGYAVFIVGHEANSLLLITFYILIAIMIIVLFFFPLARAHDVMQSEKQKLLQELSQAHRHFHMELVDFLQTREYQLRKLGRADEQRFLIGTPESTLVWPFDEETIQGQVIFDNLEKIEELYRKTEKMPVWPFDTATIIKVGSIFALNLVIVPIDLLLRLTGLIG